MPLHCIPVTAFSFADLFLDGISRECHDQSQGTNWRHCVGGTEMPFFCKRKGILKIDQSVKKPWHRLRMGVARSYSLVPDSTKVGWITSPCELIYITHDLTTWSSFSRNVSISSCFLFPSPHLTYREWTGHWCRRYNATAREYPANFNEFALKT